jgi:hypothetical protein
MSAVGKIKKIANEVKTERKRKSKEIQSTLQSYEPQSEGGEVEILQGGVIDKHSYEDAITRFIKEEWDLEEDDEQMIEINVRNQY